MRKFSSGEKISFMSFFHTLVPRMAGNLSCCVIGVRVMEDAEVAQILRLSSVCCPYTLLHWKGNSTAKKRVGVFFANPAHLLFSTYISFNSKGVMNMMLSSNESDHGMDDSSDQ